MKIIMNKCEFCSKLFVDTIEGNRKYQHHLRVHKTVDKVSTAFPCSDILGEKSILRTKKWINDFERYLRKETIKLYPGHKNLGNLYLYFQDKSKDNLLSKLAYRLECFCLYCGREWKTESDANNCFYYRRRKMKHKIKTNRL